MKIVQSFWSGNKNPMSDSYGWLSQMDHYLSWILSCNQLRKFYDDVILVTDRAGYDILIEKLRLPYTDVIVCLDELNKYNPNLWALAKIKAYSIMDEPFIHVDGDVFIWEGIDAPLQGNDLIVQNRETTTDYYRNMWKGIRPSLSYIPDALKAFDELRNNAAYNMGIFGGSDIAFIRRYCEEAFRFVDRNLSEVNKLENTNFNIFFEQVLLCELAAENNRKVGCYIHEDIGDNQYCNFANFDEVPDGRNYLHLLGFYKQSVPVSMKLRAFVLRNYPVYYLRLQKVIGVHPTVEELGIPCTNYGIEFLIDRYIVGGDSAVSFKLPGRFLLRDMSAYKATKELKYRLKDDRNFIIKIAFGFEKQEDQITIQCEDCTLMLQTLMIDDVIFGIIKTQCDRYSFNRKALEYLDEDFPSEERKPYIKTLWKRIEMLTSYGLFVSADYE